MPLLPLLTFSPRPRLVVAGCGGEESEADLEVGARPDPRGHQAEDHRAEGPKPEEARDQGPQGGHGREAKAGEKVTVQYVGTSFNNGRQFDASWDRGEPFCSRSAPAR